MVATAMQVVAPSPANSGPGGTGSPSGRHATTATPIADTTDPARAARVRCSWRRATASSNVISGARASRVWPSPAWMVSSAQYARANVAARPSPPKARAACSSRPRGHRRRSTSIAATSTTEAKTKRRAAPHSQSSSRLLNRMATALPLASTTIPTKAVPATRSPTADIAAGRVCAGSACITPPTPRARRHTPTLRVTLLARPGSVKTQPTARKRSPRHQRALPRKT